MGDVAAATLSRLAALRGEFGHLSDQLQLLAEWATDHGDPESADYLDSAARFAASLQCCVPGSVRDIAQRLPLRGLDFAGDGQANV